MRQVPVLYNEEQGTVATCDVDKLEEVARILGILQRLYAYTLTSDWHSANIDIAARRIAAPLKNLLHWRKENELPRVIISEAP